MIPPKEGREPTSPPVIKERELSSVVSCRGLLVSLVLALGRGSFGSPSRVIVKLTALASASTPPASLFSSSATTCLRFLVMLPLLLFVLTVSLHTTTF